MYLLIIYDLPTKTKKEKNLADSFRRKIKKDGFERIQLSFYSRYCANRTIMNIHKGRIMKMLYSGCNVKIMPIPDKQFSQFKTFKGKKLQKEKNKPNQLEFY